MQDTSCQLATHQTTGRIASWAHGLCLVLILAYALPLFVIHLGTGDANDMMELFNLVPAREAYRDGHWLLPTLNGAARLEKPPLAAWAPAALATLVGSDSLWIVRLPSVLLGLLTCCAVYGIGWSMTRDKRVGLFAALALPTMVIFLREARLATYDIFSAAFLTFAVWGLVNLCEAARRHMLWAAVTGAAVGLAVLSKGPTPVVILGGPMLVWMAIFHRRRAIWAALAVAAAVAVLVFVPWLLAVAVRQPDALGVWWRELVQNATGKSNNPWQTRADLASPVYYYAQFLLWVFPWTALLVAGLIMPWMKEETGTTPERERRGLWLVWLIVAGGLVLLSLQTEKKPRYALQLFPFAALLVALVWVRFCRLKPGERLTGGAKIVLALQPLILWGAAAGLAGILGLLYVLPASWGRRLHIETLRPGIEYLSTPLCAGAAVVIAVLGALAWHNQRRLPHTSFTRAFGCFAAGAGLLMLCWTAAYRGVNVYHADEYREDTERMMGSLYGDTIYTLPEYRPWLHVLYYANRILPARNVTELVALAKGSDDALYVLIPFRGKGFATQCTQAQQDMETVCRQTDRHARALMTFSDEHCELELLAVEKSSAPSH